MVDVVQVLWGGQESHTLEVAKVNPDYVVCVTLGGITINEDMTSLIRFHDGSYMLVLGSPDEVLVNDAEPARLCDECDAELDGEVGDGVDDLHTLEDVWDDIDESE